MNAGRLAMRFCLALGLVSVAFAASAGSVSELRKQAEASMLLTGSVEVTQEGTLRRFELDHPEKIDLAVRDFVERNIKSWSFEVGSLPTGVPANATILNNMSILVVAKPIEGDTFSLRIAASYFSAKEPEPDTEVRYRSVKPPEYPFSAVRAGVSGKVFLLVRIDRNGNVEEAMAEQVNLQAVADNEKEMERWRNVLAQASLKAVKRWKFTIPTRGEQALSDAFIARVPISFNLRRKKEAEYGQWTPYIPGPRHSNPWENADDNPGFAPDALAANGGVYSNNGLRLKSPMLGMADGS
ncbi:energy transducer TonB [Dokdonella sp.]|uniref:energy transducer TonB n=1 Tax=Dokdonella sp. TaxID=2291710 RepID=UPI00352940A8